MKFFIIFFTLLINLKANNVLLGNLKTENLKIIEKLILNNLVEKEEFLKMAKKNAEWKIEKIKKIIEKVNSQILSIKEKLIKKNILTNQEKVIFYQWLTLFAIINPKYESFVPVYVEMDLEIQLINFVILNDEIESIVANLSDEEILNLMFDNPKFYKSEILINNLIVYNYPRMFEEFWNLNEQTENLNFKTFDFNEITLI